MEYQKYLLRDVGDIVSGATPKTAIAENFGGDIPWLTPADLSGYTQKYISRGARNLTKQGYDSCSTQMMPSGTVLFSSRAPIGYVAIAKNPICTNQGFKSIVPKSFINSEFLYYQLIYLRKTIQNMGNGTTFKEISATKFGSVQVIAPPLEEQERIVSRIEELFSQLDASVAELKTAKERLKVYRQAVLKEAFDTALQDNPPLMPIEKLLTTERKGMSTGPFGTMIKKHEHQAIGVPMLGIENIGHGNFIDGNKIFVTSEKARELKSFALLAGDIIISRSGTVGELCAVPERMEGALLSTNLMRISLNSNIIRSDYFIYLFQSKGIVLDQVKELCKGSTRICLYIRTDFPNALHYLLVYCVSFQYDLFITKNLLMRGGITSGDMYAKGDIIFGPALTEAYLLEEKNAKVPRIIIRKKTIDEGISGMDENMLTPTRQCVFRDDDAFYALNYFQFFILEKYNEALDQAKATISNHLDTTIDESIRQKYLYVERNIKKWIKENDDA